MYICLEMMSINATNDILIFVVGCYIPHHDSNFYAYLDRDKPFANLEKDIV